MPEYVVEIYIDETLSETDLDELRQIVIDFVTPDDRASVTVSEL